MSEELLDKLEVCLDRLESLVSQLEEAIKLLNTRPAKPEKTFKPPTEEDFVCDNCKHKGKKCEVCNFGGKFT